MNTNMSTTTMEGAPNGSNDGDFSESDEVSSMDDDNDDDDNDDDDDDSADENFSVDDEDDDELNEEITSSSSSSSSSSSTSSSTTSNSAETSELSRNHIRQTENPEAIWGTAKDAEHFEQVEDSHNKSRRRSKTNRKRKLTAYIKNGCPKIWKS